MTTKTTKNDGFSTVFWSFWVLGPILAHQTAKFELSGQFRFSRHPWGPWGRLSSGVICIWKIYQLFCDSGAALADFFTFMKMDWLGFHLFNGGRGESKNLQTLSMYLLNGPPARHRSPAEQLLNCSYLTINHRIFGPYSLLCSVGCNCKPVIIRDVGTMGQGGRWERACPSRFWQIS